MKKIFFVFVAHACAFISYSQGSIQLGAGTHIKSVGGAYIVLDNANIINNGSFQQTAGNGFVKLTGATNVSLAGSSVTTIDALQLAKSSGATLSLNTDLSIVSNVNFSGGLLNLNNNVLNLGSTGVFTGESETSRAFTTGSGYIQASGILNNPSSVNLGNLGAMITSTANMGNTIIRRGHAVQTGVVGLNNSINRFFDIVPAINQNLKAVLRFFYFDTELNGIPEVTLHQYKSNNNINWDFVGANSRNTTTNYVEKISINKFDRFTLATGTAPSITCPSNITSSANQNGCKASVAFAATATGIPAPAITYRIGNMVITSPHVFSKGMTTVSVTASNGVSPDATCSFTVTVVCGPASPSITKVTAIPEQLQSDQLLISAWPNPSADHFAVLVKGSGSQPVTIRIMDMLGRVLSVQSNVSTHRTIYFGREYLPGIYFVQARQGKEVATLKLVKQ